ncbi:MAG TPA: TylF/MycF/NovP-related O-methyltransferase [Sphingomicrobium sp.]
MISLRCALHPYLPSRLGFERLLMLTSPTLGRAVRDSGEFSITPNRARVTIYREALAVLDRGISGDIAVIGAHRGGTAAPLALLLKDRPGRHLHLFDRWGDLPDPTPEDGFRAEQYRKDRIPEKLAELSKRPPLDDCRHVMHDIVGLPERQVAYYPGWFDETLAEGGPYPGAPLAFALVHCDYYQSVKRALAFVDRHVADGGAAIVNDYWWWPGSKQATDEYLASVKRPVGLKIGALKQAVLRF